MLLDDDEDREIEFTAKNSEIQSDYDTDIDDEDLERAADTSTEPSSSDTTSDGSTAAHTIPQDPSLKDSLSLEETERADDIVTRILGEQLQDCPWIVSTVDVTDEECFSNKWSYKPRVFYVYQDEFLDWLQRDGDDHFFSWVYNTQTKSRPGPRGRSLFWTSTHYVCHRSKKPLPVREDAPDGSLVMEVDTNQSNNKKRRRIFKKGHRVGCEAKIIVYDMKEADDDGPVNRGCADGGNGQVISVARRKRFKIAYFYRHTGHTLGDTADFQHLRISDDMRARIRTYVRLGLSTRRIREKLALPGSQAYIRLSKGTLLRDHLLTYEDVYNIYHRYWTAATQLHHDDITSMHMWIRKLAAEKNFFVFEWHGDTGRFALGIMSPFQQQMYLRNPHAIGLDSTHGTNRRKLELYTIMVQDPDSMKGIPVAFMITNDGSSQPLAKWLSHLKGIVGAPRFVTTDDSQVEYRAIRAAFGESVVVHLCLWHVIRTWERAFRVLIKGTTNGIPAQDARKLASNELRSILYDQDLGRARNKIAEFERNWSECSDGKLWAYVRDFYLGEPRQRRWMKAYRKGKFYAGMDTNNYVESWHNHLKSHFLRGHNHCRGDRLLYVLSHDVDAYYHAERVHAVIRVGRRSPGEILDIKQKSYMEGMSEATLQERIIAAEGKFCVRSFLFEGMFYNLAVSDDNVITGCNCSYFESKRRVCRHMLLLYVGRNAEGLRLAPAFTLKSLEQHKFAVNEADAELEPEVQAFIEPEQAEEVQSQLRLEGRIQEQIEVLHKLLRQAQRTPELANALQNMICQARDFPVEICTHGTKKRSLQR